MTVAEMNDYIAAVAMDGYTLTNCGIGAAMIILERRKGYTPAHALMLSRLQNGAGKVPLELRRLVEGTRLGDALKMAMKLARSHIHNQKQRERKARARAETAAQ